MLRARHPNYGQLMDLGLGGKRVVITGGSKGIGLGCAIALAREGCHIQIAARSQETLIGAESAIREAAEGVTVISHAVAIPAGDISTIDEHTWRAAWDLKVFGYINLCREVYPTMVKRGRGVIINVIGAAAVRPQPTYVAGAVGNSGLVGLTAALGSRSLSHGVRVVAVNPGLIVTDRMGDILRREAIDQFDDEERWEELIPDDPAPGSVEQCADVITFLASPRASHVSGTTLTIDGGASAR